MKKNWSLLLILIVILTGLGTYKLYKKDKQETIFDRIVSIPKKLILDIPYLLPLCDQIPGLKKGFVDIPNGKLYYEEEGQGIPLVLINGGPGGTHHTFHPHFSKLTDIARIIYYDQRGTGQSSIDETGKTYTVKQAVEDLEYLRKALNIDKWTVLGWSYGGFLAQCYALTYPEHLIGLILVSSSYGKITTNLKQRENMFRSPEEIKARQKIYQMEKEGKLTLKQAVYNAMLAGDWKRQAYYKPTRNEFIRMALYEWQPAPGFRDLIEFDRIRINLEEKFEDFEIPTLLIEEQWDLTWDTDKTEYMRKNHPHAQFEYFMKSGHTPFADEPKKFFTILRKFLEEAHQKQINYKPGNRLLWPEPVPALTRKVIMAKNLKEKDKQERLMMEAYQQAINEKNNNAELWANLADHFIQSKQHDDALKCLQKYEESTKKTAPENWKGNAISCVRICEGQLYDLLGKRKKALSCYQEALEHYTSNVNCWGTNMTKELIEERLKTPFKMNS